MAENQRSQDRGQSNQGREGQQGNQDMGRSQQQGNQDEFLLENC